MLKVQNARPFKHAPKSKERAKIWEKIAEKLTKEWKVDVDTRQVRERTASLVSVYRREDQLERKDSGIVPSFSDFLHGASRGLLFKMKRTLP